MSVQAYAAEQLDAREERAEAEARHGAWYASLGTDEALEAVDGPEGAERRRVLFAELDNLVARCRRAVVRADGTVAVGTLGAAWAALELRGPFVVGAELGADVLAMPLAPTERARAAWVCGQALRGLGRMDEARAHYDAALAVHREVGNRRHEGMVLNNLGLLHMEQGRMDEARAHYDAALAVLREVGNRPSEGRVLGNLGLLHREQGRMDEARAHYEAALAVHREVGGRRFEGLVLGNLGVLHMEQGRIDDARATFAEGERLLRQVGDSLQLARLLCGHARLACAEGQLADAHALLGEAEALGAELAVSADSELGKALAEARAAVDAT